MYIHIFWGDPPPPLYSLFYHINTQLSHCCWTLPGTSFFNCPYTVIPVDLGNKAIFSTQIKLGYR